MASQRNGASNARGGLSYKDWSNPDVVFDQIDTDRSETLTLKELRVFFKSSPMMDGQHLEALFATLDEDGSGEVSREEWRRGFFRAGFASNEGGSGQSRTQCPQLPVHSEHSVQHRARCTGCAAGSDQIAGASSEGLAALLSLITPPAVATFGGLHGGRPIRAIPRPEERGISLIQLHELWQVSTRQHPH